MNQKKDQKSNLSEKRISKVQHLNKKKVRNQIELFPGETDTNQEETRQQAGLKSCSEAAPEHIYGHEKENGEYGRRSIFFDKDWNLKGIAPSHHRNIPYNPRTFKRRIEVRARLGNLSNIKIPNEIQNNR
ncbi:hypothetical protein SMKI_02G3030 [Saccharomyces mikatae IFO 1815]|uniref:Uncharacterized protein n=1 Tax=Saccharomyces mikatae IFO 1815 TaxID=226126 RepID=A0AA35NFY6_SACMI|nr:uncharacterized protein SMKI_02G3030 [Saccharomyces mikatae IFO 1815]CAI4037428.1 hypothetical protein SMKI_02G3030 [Saccharomyces mikatae IFO 1815]